jgi:UrcA family protein
MKHFITRASTMAALVAMTGLVSTVEANVFVESAPTREVYYGDLDLNTQSGLLTLHGRIEQAADQVCGVNLTRLRLEEIIWVKQCRENAIAGAVSTVNQAQLTQRYSKTLLISAAR